MDDIKKYLDKAIELQDELNRFVDEITGINELIPSGFRARPAEYTYFLSKFAQLQGRINSLEEGNDSPFNRMRREAWEAGAGICHDCNHNTPLGRTCKVEPKGVVHGCKEWVRRAKFPDMENLNIVRGNVLGAFRTHMAGVFIKAEKGKLDYNEFLTALDKWMRDEKIV